VQGSEAGGRRQAGEHMSACKRDTCHVHCCGVASIRVDMDMAVLLCSRHTHSYSGGKEEQQCCSAGVSYWLGWMQVLLQLTIGHHVQWCGSSWHIYMLRAWSLCQFNVRRRCCGCCTH